MSQKTFIIGAQGLGRGDDRLGGLLMANFLRLLGETAEKPVRLIFWNDGVKLCCKGSAVMEHLLKLESQGVELLACTTCLEYFDLAENLQVGKPTTMLKSIQAMFENEVVSL